MTTIADFYSGRSVLLTGGTGFLGKQIIEKLLRSCPGLNSIYIMVRPKKGRDIAERLNNLFESQVFDRLRQEQPDFQSHIVALPGDMMATNLGIDDEHLKLLQRDVSVIIHSAATINFNEKLSVALKMNVVGVKKMLHLAKTLPKLEAFVHVSTAYAYCHKELCDEEIYEPPVDPEKLISMVESTSDAMLEKITPGIIHPWPNTYTFTKSLAESLLCKEKDSIPCTIFRPSIVTASASEPVKGWIDNLNGATGIMAGVMSGFATTLYGGLKNTADVVPVDLVANGIIAMGWSTAVERRNDVLIYNFTSGQLNPITWQDFWDQIIPFANSHPCGRVCREPWADLTHSWIKRNFNIHIEQNLRMHALDMLLRIFGKKPKLKKIHSSFVNMISVIEYFTVHEWYWTNNNLQQLTERMSQTDKQEFNFDIKTIDWKEYLADYLKGIKVYLMREKWTDVPRPSPAYRVFWWLNRVSYLALFTFILRLVWTRVNILQNLLPVKGLQYTFKNMLMAQLSAIRVSA